MCKSTCQGKSACNVGCAKRAAKPVVQRSCRQERVALAQTSVKTIANAGFPRVDFIQKGAPCVGFSTSEIKLRLI